MATPSAKPAATPTHLTSSPHPSSAPLSRSIAYKSPSTRTPTASGPGAAHPVSASSHQYATPLAVASAVDDPVNFSSPSALLALGGYAGISPGAAVHDGLVGSGMNENDIQSLNMQGLKLGITRDSDEEMRHRIEEVVQCFRARVTGRGVSRESVERLSRLEGFESIWQENDINIAGNFVDLEIEFHARRDVVKNVSLRYATPDYQDGEVREEATAVLRRNLIQTAQDGDSGNWRSLQGFYENLKWLAKLDKLSKEVNCFEALEGLEESFKKIWAEEAKGGRHGGDYDHLCTGAIGRPSMHKGSRIGLSLEYWVAQAKALDAKKQKTSPDAMAIDQPQDQGERDELDDQRKTWQAMIECGEGYPSLRISKEWVANEVLTAGGKSESSPQGGAAETVNWLDPPQTTRLSHDNHPDPMALDSSMLESSPPNRRFVARLEPALDVPILAAAEIYRQLGMQLPQEYRMVTYEDLLLQNALSSPLSTKSSSRVDGRKRRMSVCTFDSTGTPSTKHHSYAFVVSESVAGRTIRDLPFTHPRQLAEIFPVLRQYAFITNLFRKVFCHPVTEMTDKHRSSKAAARNTTLPADQGMPFITGKEGIITLSNDNHGEDKLDYLLSGTFPGPPSEPFGISSEARNLHQMFSDDVKVDVTLSPQLERPPALMILITDPSGGSKEPLREPIRVSLCFHIGLNGRVTVEDSSGLETDINEEHGDTEMQGADEDGSRLHEIHRKLARVLEISQDLGILVEWVLLWVRQRDGRG